MTINPVQLTKRRVVSLLASFALAVTMVRIGIAHKQERHAAQRRDETPINQ